MKKTILFIVLALLCQIFGTKAQDPVPANQPVADPSALGIGDKVPDLYYEYVLNGDGKPLRLSDFQGKAVILDCWGTWCGSCISAIPHMQEIQQKYSKNLQVFLIADSKADTRELLNRFLENRRKGGEEITLPVIHDPVQVQKLFPHRRYPHYIWIGANGRVRAFTARTAVTPENIERLISGLPLYLPVKEQ